MPFRKTQTLLAALALALAVLAPLWHSSPHHGLPGDRLAQGQPEREDRLAASGCEDPQAGTACPVCLHQRLLSHSCVESMAAVAAPASTTRPCLDPVAHPVSHRSLPPGARAPPAC
jgi:hypothetical protein